MPSDICLMPYALCQSSSTTARMGPGGVAEIQQQHRGSDGQERVMLERRLGDRAVAEECLMPYYALCLLTYALCL